MADPAKPAELPRECWEIVFSFLNFERDLESLSMACKQFLSISNSLRSSLSVPDQLAPYLPSTLSRFKSLKSIDLSSFGGNTHYVLRQIARFHLPLRTLNLSNMQYLPLDGLREIGSKFKALGVLVLSKIGLLQDNDLFSIADYFPSLEELDISYPEHSFSLRVTDVGVSVLSQKLKRLSRIDISGNHFVTDQSLVALSANCEFLSEIRVRDCSFVTQVGVASVIRNRPDLVSLSVSNAGLSYMYLPLVESFCYARGLRSLDLSDSFISDDLLCSVAKANIQLRSLSLSHSSGFTFDGISEVLLAHRWIELLHLQAVDFLTDHYMSALSKILRNLTIVNANLCTKLTNTTFYELTKRCPSLREIRMERTNLRKDDTAVDTSVNSQVEVLMLSRNACLSDECLKKFVRICPKLRYLDVSYCPELTEDSILDVLGRCRKISHLQINECKMIKNLHVDFDLPRLEVLQATGVGLNDQELAAIGRRCYHLKCLDLRFSFNVSNAGVREVVSYCTALREINLKWCYKMDVDIIAWMVFSRPSLRKIVPPCGFVPSESQREFFLQHGCLVSDG